MLKVLNITEEGRYAGPHKRICEVAVRLRAHHDIETVALFSRFRSERFQKVLNKNDVRYHGISMHRLTKDLKHLLGYVVFFIPEVWRIYQIIKEEKPNVVHCNGSYQIKGVIACWLAGVPEVWHMSDTYIPGYVRALFKSIYKLFSSKHFIFASKRTQSYYFPGNKVDELKSHRVIQAPIDVSSFTPNKEYVMPYNNIFDGIRILTVGNVNFNKNHELYIRMAHAFKQLHPDINIRFYVAGAIYDSQEELYNSLRDLMEELNVDNVEFLGERRDIKELLHYADAYVCPSAFEASPIAVWEALAMAKPIVSTDVGDVEYVVNKYNCGMVGDKNNPEEMADLLGRLVSDEAKRTQMGANARKAAVEELDLSICAKNHADCYKSVIDNGAPKMKPDS